MYVSIEATLPDDAASEKNKKDSSASKCSSRVALDSTLASVIHKHEASHPSTPKTLFLHSPAAGHRCKSYSLLTAVRTERIHSAAHSKLLPPHERLT